MSHRLQLATCSSRGSYSHLGWFEASEKLGTLNFAEFQVAVPLHCENSFGLRLNRARLMHDDMGRMIFFLIFPQNCVAILASCPLISVGNLDERARVNTSVQDAELVNRTLEGDKDAYVLLVRRYERLARVVAMRFLQNHHAVEDTVQQAFLMGFQRLNSLREPKSFGAWIVRIVQREAQAACRSRQKHVQWVEVMEPSGDHGRENEAIERIIESLHKLPEQERVVITLHYLDGHSTPEIAAMLSRPLGTVTKQLSRAVARLRKLAQYPERIYENESID